MAYPGEKPAPRPVQPVPPREAASPPEVLSAELDIRIYTLKSLDFELGTTGYVAIEIRCGEAAFKTEPQEINKAAWNQGFQLPLENRRCRVEVNLHHTSVWSGRETVIATGGIDVDGKQPHTRVDVELKPVEEHHHLKSPAQIDVSYAVTEERDKNAILGAKRSQLKYKFEDVVPDLITISIYYNLSKQGLNYLLELAVFLHGPLSCVFCLSFWVFMWDTWIFSWMLCWLGILIMQCHFYPPKDPREGNTSLSIPEQCAVHRVPHAWTEIADALDHWADAVLFYTDEQRGSRLVSTLAIVAVLMKTISIHWMLFFFGLFQFTLGAIYYHRPAAREYYPPSSIIIHRVVNFLTRRATQSVKRDPTMKESGDLTVKVVRATCLLKTLPLPPGSETYVTLRLDGESQSTTTQRGTLNPEFGEEFRFNVEHAGSEVEVEFVSGQFAWRSFFELRDYCENQPEIVALPDVRNPCSAGVVVLSYTFSKRKSGSKDDSARQRKSFALHAFMDRKFADFGRLNLSLLQARRLDSTGPFLVDVVADGTRRYRSKPSSIPPPGESLSRNPTWKGETLNITLDSRAVDVVVKVYDVGGSGGVGRVKVGQGSFTVKGAVRSATEQWVDLTTETGKEAGSLCVQYTTLFKHDGGFFDALSNETDAEYRAKKAEQVALMPQPKPKELQDCAATVAMYSSLAERGLLFVVDLLFWDAEKWDWSLIFCGSFLFAAFVERLLGWVLGCLTVFAYFMQKHPLRDPRAHELKGMTADQIMKQTYIYEWLPRLAAALDSVAQKAIFWNWDEENSWNIVFGFVGAGVFILMVNLYHPLRLLGFAEVGLGLAYYFKPDLKKQYPPENLLNMALKPLLGHEPITPRKRNEQGERIR